MTVEDSVDRLLRECTVTVNEFGTVTSRLDEERLTGALMQWLALLGVHDFVGRPDRGCDECHLTDRSPIHGAAYVQVDA